METFLRIGVGNAVVATLFALVAAAAGRLVARRPAVRHGLWLLVLFKLITPPLEIVDVGWLSPSRPPELEAGATSALDTAVPVEIDEVPAIESDAASVQVAEPAPLFEPLRAVVPLLATLWVLGSLVTLSVVAVRIARWNRILADLKPASDAVCDDVAELAMPMGLRTPPSVWWTPGSSTPLVWAFFCNARLIIPGQLWSRLDQDQRTTLLIHELAHLRRRDHWVRPIELVVAIVYWWLPTAWIARRALREAEEQCCDAWVVWLCPKAARTYAETLLETVDFLSESGPALPLAASGFGSGHVHQLKVRIRMIMHGTTPRGSGWVATLGLFGLSALLLPLSPTWGQDAGENPAAETPAAAKGTENPAAGEQEPEDDDAPKPGTADAETKVRKKVPVESSDGRKPAQRKRYEIRVNRSRGERGRDDDRSEATEARSLERRKAELELLQKRGLIGLQIQQAKEKALKEHAAKEMEHAASDEEMRRAVSEVQRARAALQAAEARLMRLKGASEHAKLFEIHKREFEAAASRLANARETIRKPASADARPRTVRPDRERLIDDIEKRLDELTREFQRLKAGDSSRK